MSQRDTVIHLIAGGTAGTVGAIVTCPLEVVKTRLQSSTSGFYLLPPPPPPSAPSSNLSSLSSSVTTSKISENSSRFTPYHHHYQQFSHYHHHHHHHHHHHQKPQHQQHHHPRHHRTWSTIVRPSAQQKIRRLSSTNSSRYSRYAIAALSSQYSGEIRRNGISVPTTAGVTTTSAASAPHLAIRSTATITNGQYHYHSKLFPSKPYQHHRHHLHNSHLPPPSQRSPGLIHCLRYIVKYEGVGALFKGLGPNLVGVAPSRAIYFCTYSQSKSFFNSNLPTAPDSAMVHVFSAACAGFMACTATNPIWFVKTRLQLDHSHAPHNRSSAIECIKKIYRQSGYLGFYKGIVASYVGISETVIHFVIYEAVKSWLIKSRARDSIKNNSNFKDNNNSSSTSTKTSRDFVEFMAAGALSKTVASCIAYPHEVIRTRLREEGTKYKRFWQTLNTVYTEESIRGLYRGLTTQLVRQIPNTAIMMATYECVVYVLKRKFQPSSDKFTSVSNTSNTSNNKNTENLSTNTTTSPTNTTSPSSSSTQLRYSSKNKQKGEFISH